MYTYLGTHTEDLLLVDCLAAPMPVSQGWIEKPLLLLWGQNTLFLLAALSGGLPASLQRMDCLLLVKKGGKKQIDSLALLKIGYLSLEVREV